MCETHTCVNALSPVNTQHAHGAVTSNVKDDFE